MTARKRSWRITGLDRRPRAYGKHNAAAVLHASAITGRTTGASGSPTATAPTPASASIMLHTPKRRIVPSAQRPAPYLPPALSAVRFTSWVMTGAHGHPTEIKPTPIPASATPAIRRRKTATFGRPPAETPPGARNAMANMAAQTRASTNGGSVTPMATAPTPVYVLGIPPTQKRAIAPA